MAKLHGLRGPDKCIYHIGNRHRGDGGSPGLPSGGVPRLAPREITTEISFLSPEFLHATASPASSLKSPTPWTVDELAAAEADLEGGRDFQNGRRMFSCAACDACRRFGKAGGMNGPDLTGVGGRYKVRDLLTLIIDPSSQIDEPFALIVVAMNDGLVHTGLIVNLNEDMVQDGSAGGFAPPGAAAPSHAADRSPKMPSPVRIATLPSGLRLGHKREFSRMRLTFPRESGDSWSRSKSPPASARPLSGPMPSVGRERKG